LAGDSIDYFLSHPQKLINRENTLLIASLSQLQKIASPNLIQQNADFIKVIEQVSGWASQTKLSVVTIHPSQALVAYQQQISTTPVNIPAADATLAAYATVWWLQQPEKPFEALSSAAYYYSDST
jgi:hypothetical protein